MKIDLRIQDPTANTTLYVIDAIGKAAEGATSGYALFAFATVAGVDLLLDHESIQNLTYHGRFEIIVGIDAITNRQTLQRLIEASRHRRGLYPRVFWNNSGGIFHPKLCHFRNARRESWIVGSGNLTPRGLRDNYEAFTIIKGKGSELAALSKHLTHFLNRHASEIREIDKAALERASLNTPKEPVRKIEPTISRPIKDQRRPLDGRNPVLVAELAKGGTRWQQANFDGATVRDFFDVERTPSSLRKELYFNELDDTGSRVSEEVRRFTFTQSLNLRVQLAAKNGVAYPTKGRPIAVFRKVKPRHFAYQLLLPGEKGYMKLKTMLDKNESGTVRRHITSIDKLRGSWPNSPLG